MTNRVYCALVEEINYPWVTDLGRETSASISTGGDVIPCPDDDVISCPDDCVIAPVLMDDIFAANPVDYLDPRDLDKPNFNRKISHLSLKDHYQVSFSK